MTTAAAAAAQPTVRLPPALFATTVFASAALVFMVEPMIAKLVLPLLGGAAAVWNTSLAFFQIALLAGYGYAHLLQRIPRVAVQAVVHCAAVALAALALPLRVHEAFGPPSSAHPILWELGVLTVSIGAPFAILSATAPLVQAWHARTVAAEEGKEPYVLYAASNLGSLLALIAYPLVVEPTVTVKAQTLGWSLGYGAFGLLLASLGLVCARAAEVRPATPALTAPVAWRMRLTWVALAAIPSSLMLGVTTHLTTDVASAPFLWVAPLALYLLTFVIAFQAKPVMTPWLTLTFQAAAVAACATLLPFRLTAFPLQLLVHLSAFFFTALVCHQALVARRPPPARLTEFYLWMSLGGVVGGAFNAFLAPVIFDNVWEYPLVLALACLARPVPTEGRLPAWVLVVTGLGIVAGIAAPVVITFTPPQLAAHRVIGSLTDAQLIDAAAKLLLALASVSAFLVRWRYLPFFMLIAVLSLGASAAADRLNATGSWRSFFGVVRESETRADPLGGRVRMLAHGTTLHGAQAQNPLFRCRPLVYYTPHTPIGQTLAWKQAQSPALRLGVVGLGAGSVAAYVRPGDHMTFFEIDPLVIRIATDPKHFSYTTECARGPVDYVTGDARLTLGRQPAGQFDVLLIDAFSSDAVPTHLLTVEAVRGYLTKLKPDGVVILHLSNRNLELNGPAQAVAKAAGGYALIQNYEAPRTGDWESSEDAVVIAKSPQALAGLAADRRWRPVDATQARPWTDDYTNLIGALWRRSQERWRDHAR
jgi:SAM-dependent methyltransferase